MYAKTTIKNFETNKLLFINKSVGRYVAAGDAAVKSCLHSWLQF